MNTYQKNKTRAKQNAIAWLLSMAITAPTWGEIAESQAYFEKIGKRYGLLKEFRENGII